MISRGAFTPVQISKFSAAWLTSMPRPVSTFAPWASAFLRNTGMAGLNTTSHTGMPGRI